MTQAIIDNSMSFPMSELYPNFDAGYNYATDLKANPDYDDQESLNEPSDVSEKADPTRPSGKMVFLAIAAICLMVIFMGVS